MHQDRADAARARITEQYRVKRRVLLDECKRDLARARAHLREATEMIQRAAAQLALEERMLEQGDTTISLPALPMEPRPRR
jgi:TPR repeat protein